MSDEYYGYHSDGYDDGYGNGCDDGYNDGQSEYYQEQDARSDNGYAEERSESYQYQRSDGYSGTAYSSGGCSGGDTDEASSHASLPEYSCQISVLMLAHFQGHTYDDHSQSDGYQSQRNEPGRAHLKCEHDAFLT